MRRAAFIVAAVVLALASAAEDVPATISGIVLHQDVPLPGTTIRLLEAGREVSTTTTDSEGRYSMSGLPHGYYDLVASLEGMVSVLQEIHVGKGETLLATPVSLELQVFEEPITMACGSPCDGEEQPTCVDYERNRTLEETAARDSLALEQLRERYRHTTSRAERARIGGFLVSVLENDDEYFAPLASSTELLLSFSERSEEELTVAFPEYVSWCDTTGRDPGEELWNLEEEAFALFTSTDPRVVYLAHRALRADEMPLQFGAVAYASLTCDQSLIAAIDDEFDAISGRLGVSLLAELVPCGDPVLNEKITALDEDEARNILPIVIEGRNAALARLGSPSATK